MANFFKKIVDFLKLGRCKYCYEKNWFGKSHAECIEKYNDGWVKMVLIASDAAKNGNTTDNLENELINIADSHFIARHQVRDAVINGWEKALNEALEENILSEEDESKLIGFAKYYSLTQDDLDKNGSYTRAIQSCVLRDVISGNNLVPRIKTDIPVPFNLQKSEVLVWLFRNTQYFEEKTRTQKSYVGGCQGVSIMIMKGVYYRVGGFKGHPIVATTTSMEHIDTGILGITDKHFYFLGSRKSFRMPYKKIVSYIPYDDGIAIHRDAVTAKPQIFKTGDGWFVYNLVKNLSLRSM